MQSSQREQAKLEAEIGGLIDQLPSPVTMYGRRIHNPQGKRKSYDIHPYTKQGSGVSCTLMYIDEKSGVPHVLLSKKKNKLQYDQLGGYTRGQEPEGSEVNFDKRSEDERDRDEEALIGNENAVKIERKKEEKFTPSSSYTLKKLKEASTQGFEEQQSEKLGKKINPIQMKASLAKRGISFNNDYNAWDTALREIKEETGLDLKKIKPKELYTSDDFGVTNEDERLHTKATHYLFYLGKLTEPPLVKAGSDIEQLRWIAVTNIDLAKGMVKEDLAIRKSYLLQTLPRALKKLRELELACATNNVFVKYKSVCELDKNHYLGEEPLDPFSKVALEYHQNIIAKAISLKKQIDDIQNQGRHSFWSRSKVAVVIATVATAGLAIYTRSP